MITVRHVQGCLGYTCPRVRLTFEIDAETEKYGQCHKMQLNTQFQNENSLFLFLEMGHRRLPRLYSQWGKETSPSYLYPTPRGLRLLDSVYC